MKKFFLFLIAFSLCAGVNLQAQRVSVQDGLPRKLSGKTGFLRSDKTNQTDLIGMTKNPVMSLSGTDFVGKSAPTGRNNAPQTSWYGIWSYADEGNSVMNTNGCSLKYSTGNQRVWLYQWDQDLQIYFCFNNTNTGSWTSPISGVTVTMPPKGTYTISSSRAAGRIGNIDAKFSGSYTCSRYIEDGTSFYFYSGTWYVDEGADGPYMYCTNLSLRYIYSNSYYDPMEGDYLAFRIGDPAVYRTVTVKSDDETMGTVSYAMKSGYVYTNNITEWKDGSTYTLTATPKQGYHFVQWKKGNTNLSYNMEVEVTITENATYTAYFEPDGEAGVYITATSNDSYTDNTGADAEWRYWQYSGKGTGSDNNLYSFTLKYNASATVGSFATALADAEVTSLYQGSTKIEWTSVTTEVEETETGKFQLTATFIGTDEKKYVVTAEFTDDCAVAAAEEPQLAWYQAYSFSNSSDHITLDIFTDPEVWEEPGYGMWYHRDKKDFIRISAYNSAGVYVQCFLWAGAYTNNYIQNYTNGIGPKVGTYSVSVDPDVDMEYNTSDGDCLSIHWKADESYVASGNAVFFNQHKWSYNGDCSDYTTISMDCMYSTFVAIRNSSTSFSNIQSLEGFTINVTVGKDGYPYIEFIDTEGDVAITIGEPVPFTGYKLDTYVNGSGSVAKSPDECLYAEGTQVVLTPVPAGDEWTFIGWTGDCANLITYNGDGTYKYTVPANDCAVIANFTSGTLYDVVFKNFDGEELQSDKVLKDQMPVYAGTTPERASDEYHVYTFSGWSDGTNIYGVNDKLPAVTGDVTYTAVFNEEVHLYNVRFENFDGSELQTYQVEWNAVPAYEGTPARENDGDEYNWYEFTFTGWTDADENTYGANDVLPAVTADITYTAQYSKKLYIILQENMDADYYTNFHTKYNGERATTATLNRQFTQGKWATLCLPFTVSAAQLTALGLMNRVFVFKYATGEEQDGLTLYFSQAKKMDAGIGYIVNANASLANKESFVFANALINTSTDEQSGFDIANLTGYNSDGSSIYIVGTLRTGTVYASESGSHYMGLKDNKIYSPNSEQGTPVRAYRGIFLNTGEEALPARVRIVAESEEGETVTELEVVNGGLEEVSETHKFIRDGILYIERNGELFDAQGKRLE